MKKLPGMRMFGTRQTLSAITGECLLGMDESIGTLLGDIIKVTNI